MANIKGVELKGTKKTSGREGCGFTANVYLNNKKVGDVADYGDGSICLSINMKKEDENKAKEIAKSYYTQCPKWGVKVEDDYILNDFFRELYELKENETVYKKQVKKGFDKMLILSQCKRDEDLLAITSYIYEDVTVSCKYQGDEPTKTLMEKIEKAYPNTKCIIAKYNKLEDFDIK